MLRATAWLLFATALFAAPPKKAASSGSTAPKSAARATSAKSAGKGSAQAVRVSSHARAGTRTAQRRTATAKGRGKGRKIHSAPAPSYQLHPEPERYTQIQQALAERGYFKGTVTGEWNDESVDAMRRFQADRKIDNDGKIDALSLTGLGLGPRHDGSTASAVSYSGNPAPPPPSAEPAPAGPESDPPR